MGKTISYFVIVRIKLTIKVVPSTNICIVLCRQLIGILVQIIKLPINYKQLLTQPCFPFPKTKYSSQCTGYGKTYSWHVAYLLFLMAIICGSSIPSLTTSVHWVYSLLSRSATAAPRFFILDFTPILPYLKCTLFYHHKRWHMVCTQPLH